MERLIPAEVDVRRLSPHTLAFVGDGVYELMVREMLACEVNRPSGELHKLSVGMVRAEAQSAAIETLLPLLTEQEARCTAAPKRAYQRTDSDYHRATGLEALFGYLYLTGDLNAQVLFYRIRNI